MKYKKSQVKIFVWVMIAIMVFIVATQLSKPTLDEVTRSRNASGLNCTNPNLDASIKTTCVVMDMSLFYFIGILIAVSIAVLTKNNTLIGITTSIMVFVITTILITPLKDFIVFARNASNLNCAGASLTVGTRLLCIFFDLWLFYFFMAAIAAGVTLIFVKKVLPQK